MNLLKICINYLKGIYFWGDKIFCVVYFRRCKFFHFFALICFCGWLNFNNFAWAYFCGYQICNLYTHYFNRVERTLYYKITEDIPNQPIYFLIQIVKKQNSFLKNDPVLRNNSDKNFGRVDFGK